MEGVVKGESRERANSNLAQGNERPSFRRFVRSHDKILTVVGALIVFMTFLVREGLREMYKESSASLETGINAYEIQCQLGDMAQVLASVQAQTDISWRRLYGVDTSNINRASLTDRINADKVRLASMMRRLGSLAHALVEAPYEERIPIGKQLGNLLEQVEAQNALISRVSPDEKASDKLDAIETKTKELQEKSETLSDKAISLGLQYSTSFSEARDVADEFSYILYALGWGLTLIGKLFGNGPVAGEI